MSIDPDLEQSLMDFFEFFVMPLSQDIGAALGGDAVLGFFVLILSFFAVSAAFAIVIYGPLALWKLMRRLVAPKGESNPASAKSEMPAG